MIPIARAGARDGGRRGERFSPRGEAPAPPREAGEERRRSASCAYRADAFGDRLVGYDGARREAWVVRLDGQPV